MPLTSPGNDDDTGENHQPTLRKNTAEPVEQTLKQNRFARHTRLRDGLGMDTYFADPYSSRRRGSNENRNGMIRRYLPKRSEIRMGMAGELREIVDEADNRPMRVLDYRTPAEAFADELL